MPGPWPRCSSSCSAIPKRRRSARFAGQIGDPRSIEPLCALLESDREDVRREARGALAHLSRQPLGAEEKKRVLAALGSGAREGTPAPGRSSRGEEAHVATNPPTTPLPIPPVEPRRDHTTQLPSAKPAAVTMNIADLRPGFVLLERYRIIEKIGHGGFGAVYLVEDAAIQEDVILKVLNPMLSEDEKQLQRFIQELKLTRRITHKNVIRIFDFLDLGGAHAVSMEYCPGRDLGHLLDDEGPMEASRLLRLILQVSAGLAAAHDAGVVHRDIKPSNILIGAADQVKIVDFGLAWAHARVGSRLTSSGLLIGTPEYMAPELIQGDVADHRADIYSVGIMMYEMLSGKKPYASDNPVRILFQHLEGDLVPLRDLVPGLSPEVGALVERCMARDPEGRPADVRELGVLADRALQHGTQAGCESHG